MKRWVCVSVLAAAAGCNGLSTLNQATYERMMMPLMTDVQKAEYYKRPTWPERKAYLYEISVMRTFEAAPPTIQGAIRAKRVVKGMTADQVLMSWGRPAHRFVIPPEAPDREGRREQWLYSRVLTPDFQVRYRRAVSFVNGVVLHVRDDRR